MSPPILSSTTLCSVIRMLHLLCRQCSDLAVRLLHLSKFYFLQIESDFLFIFVEFFFSDVVAALRLLLLGTVDPSTTGVELLARTPQELYELVLLIG